ncbi:MAG TPA: chemotaxis protein CheA [Rhizomicrobium sp.]|nr:chemotaxis protein CheA [Rhizomicrobium sp.]
MDPLDAIKQTYFQECDELLLAMEEGLLAMESGEADSETVNAVFRAVHSIKGGGGAFGFTDLVSFAHIFETVLDMVRSGKLQAGADVVKELLRAGDGLADHVRAAQSGTSRPAGWDDDIKASLSVLAGETSRTGAASEAAGEEEPAFTPMGFAFDDEPAAPAATPKWRIGFRPHTGLLAKANEPFLILRELAGLGQFHVTADLSAVPALVDFAPDQSYLAWDIELETEKNRSDIEAAFDFVTGDCDLTIEQDVPPPDVEVAAPSFEAAAQVEELHDHAAPEAANHPLPEQAGDAAKTDAGANARKTTVRVDLDKVDRLVNLVGEMVIAQAMLLQQTIESGLPVHSPVNTAVKDLDHLLRDLQESVMAIRTQPVKSVFQRMPRLVRELAAQTGKPVRLVTEGEATEVDKTVIERLGEPLTHMIRNAVDHGLESVEARIKAGKPEEGTVRLSAEHRGGRIVIEVSDDGGGINRERVKAKAIEKGLIAANAALSDEEIDNLIFLPGFSTASAVSDISGRGVGMDVVRKSITDLGGRIIISSVPGKGSRFILTLPLTLAVLDGMLVGVGEETFVVPLTHVVESLLPKKGDVRQFGPSSHLLNVRGAYVPILGVGQLLGTGDDRIATGDGVIILVESDGTGRLALEVDRIIGQRQVVIKSFEDNYRSVQGIAAATILGDGRVALILDIESLIASGRSVQAAISSRIAVGGTAA